MKSVQNRKELQASLREMSVRDSVTGYAPAACMSSPKL